MSNPFYRVDNRLMHGQIIATWLPHLRFRRVVIISDTVPDNLLQMSMFQMAVPAGVRFEAMTLEAGAQWLEKRGYGRDSTIILIETVDDAVRLFEKGHTYPALNLGNIHHAPKRTRFTNAVYLGRDQLKRLDALMRHGVKVEIQSLPTEAPIDLKSALAG
jgi:mannose/fructose/N-acetylgalactosamine-specific phosphotransferase system component IIB